MQLHHCLRTQVPAKDMLAARMHTLLPVDASSTSDTSLKQVCGATTNGKSAFTKQEFEMLQEFSLCENLLWSSTAAQCN